jgi:hypothetical protein
VQLLLGAREMRFGLFERLRGAFGGLLRTRKARRRLR